MDLHVANMENLWRLYGAKKFSIKNMENLMEIHAFYGESGLRNFEATSFMEKLNFDKL